MPRHGNDPASSEVAIKLIKGPENVTSGAVINLAIRSKPEKAKKVVRSPSRRSLLEVAVEGSWVEYEVMKNGQQDKLVSDVLHKFMIGLHKSGMVGPIPVELGGGKMCTAPRVHLGIKKNMTEGEKKRLLSTLYADFYKMHTQLQHLQASPYGPVIVSSRMASWVMQILEVELEHGEDTFGGKGRADSGYGGSFDSDEMEIDG